MTIQSLSLINAAGTSVSLLTTPQVAEFIHLNASSAPLLTANVPQDVYTSVAVTYSDPSFTCATLNASGGFVFSTFAAGFGTQPATVTLPSPLTVSGTVMALSLELQASKSATFSGCTPKATFSITPVFNVTALPVVPQPTNERNGKVAGVNGRLSSVNVTANTFSLQATNGYSFPNLANGPALSVKTNAGTVYQGIGGLSALTVGMFVDLDAAIQSDGSLTATRVAVEDATALNVMTGPIASVDKANSLIVDMGRQQQGNDLSVNPIFYQYFSFAPSTHYQTSGQFANPQGLPFTAVFDGSSMAAGQNVSLSFMAMSYYGGTYTAADTITLVPQTINGTVNAVSTSGSFTVYTVALAPYDFIPALSGATRVVVYVDGNTQMFASAPITVGGVARFRGLLFNDNGVLRMVAGQVQDGVAE